ncbi:MAG: hypothetical protein HOO96_24365 [Polyangiaceae bacterium]|nr:hypothetical protein [Polyangiaceae bacterium]
MPTVVDHVRRAALQDALEASRRRYPITWVVGLPGAGKTSLVARWVSEAAGPCVWYRLEAEDADVAALFHALGAAGIGGGRLPVWSPEYHAELSDFTRRFFSQLAAGAAAAGQSITVVLDDCHRIPDASPTMTLIETVREVCTDSLRVVAVSRRAPPPSLARGQVGGWLAIMDDLRLSESEARDIATLVRGDKLSAAEARTLEKADGWLAHVLALARSGKSSTAATFQARAAAAKTATEVGDFLAAELLGSVPAEQRAGLRRLAELPEIPHQLAELRALTPEVRRLLGTLSTQRYFVDEVGLGNFRLHDLLRDALLARNAAEDDQVTLDGVRLELAACIAPQMPEAAMQLRVRARDTRGALDLLEAHGDAWIARGLHQTIHEWIRGLPDDGTLGARSALAFWRGQALLPLEPEAARPLFAAARLTSIEARDPERAYAAWCGEVGSYVVQWGAVHGLAALVDDLEALHGELGPPQGALAFRTSEGALTALMYGRAEDPRIGRYAEAVAQAVAHSADPGTRIGAAGQLLIYKLWWAGDFPAGRAIYETFDQEVSSSEHLPPLPRLVWWSCAAIVDWQCGRAEDCYDKVERGLALAESSGIHVRDFFLLTQGIFCALSEEDWIRAERYLGQLAHTERTHRRLDAMVYHFFRSWYSLCRGDARTARAHAETALPMAEAMGSMFHKVIVLSALAPACVHSGDLEGAERAYRAQIELAKAANNPTFSFIAFCAGAEIAMARGDEAATRKQVERMLLVKHLGGFHSGCGWRTPMMQKVLAFALEKDVWPEVARQWIREKAVPPPADVPVGWPMPVTIEAADGLKVVVEGHAEAPREGGKSPQKLRELLAVLVAERDGAAQTEVQDWLWPDSDGDRAATSLKVAIHRLRQWLGADAVRVHGGRVSLNPERVACDLWRKRADAAPLVAERVLAGIDLPPVLALRRRLRASR